MKKIIALIRVPILLIAFWVIASLFFNNAISFSVLVYQQSKTDIKQLPPHKLLMGEKIIGEFKAEENYLGIVQLRFNNYVKDSYAGEDELSFAIKEKGSKDWYSFSYYRSGLLEHNLLFPFGFKPINNSKDKTYEFEITSLRGNDANAVEVDRNNLTLLTEYKIPKSEIVASKKTMVTFIFKKFITSFTNIDFLLSSSVYLLPLLLYYILLFGRRWKLNKNFKIPSLTLILLSVLIDILFLKQMYLGIQVLLISVWIFGSIKYKISSKVDFSIAFTLIFLWLLLMPFHTGIIQNKINFWSYCFLVIGTMLAIVEEKFRKKKNEKI